MDLDINYFRSIQNASGLETKKEVILQEVKENLAISMQDSMNIEHEARRNGTIQPLIVSPTKVGYKVNVSALPGYPLYAGDILKFYNEQWIVVETNALKQIQSSGVAWLCNVILKFQDSSYKVTETAGVLDFGSYVSSLSSDKQMQVIEEKIKIYLPQNINTSKIHTDKRLATGTEFDSHGDEVLSVYKVISPYTIGYGKGAHLLTLNVIKDIYRPDVDNMAKKICDYIKQPEVSVIIPDKLLCSIIGRPTITAGKSRDYSAVFFDLRGQPIDTVVQPVWSISTPIIGVELSQNNNIASLAVDNKEALVGSKIALSVVDEDNSYNPATYIVEVI